MEEKKVTWAAARVNAGLSQEQAAAALGISTTTLINYEKYRSFPDANRLVDMSRLYHRSVDLIFLTVPAN